MLSFVIVTLIVFFLMAQLRFLVLCVFMAIAGDPPPSPAGRLTEFPSVAIQVAAYREAAALPCPRPDRDPCGGARDAKEQGENSLAPGHQRGGADAQRGR